MIQIVYKNKFYINGTFRELMEHIKELESSFKTVKEFLEHRTGKL